MTSAYVDTVEDLQTQFLESLGIFLKAYSPPDAVGRGGVVYANQSLRMRILYAGFQGPTIKQWFSGEVAMTTRTMFAVAKAAQPERGQVAAMKVQWIRDVFE